MTANTTPRSTEFRDLEQREPLEVPDLGLFTSQEAFGLSRWDFERLKQRPPWYKRADIFGTIFGGELVFVVGKIIDWLVRGGGTENGPALTSSIHTWELWVLAVSMLAWFATWCIAKVFPDDRSDVVERIENHFEEKPNFREIRRRK